MSRRIPVILLFGVLAFAVGCTNKKVNNPLSNVGSKQPDKVLFDRGYGRHEAQSLRCSADHAAKP